MSGQGKEDKSAKDKVCRVVIQQCTNAQLKFDTEDSPVSIANGMVIFTCFLQGATLENLDSIVKAVLEAKLCEPAIQEVVGDSSTSRKSVLQLKNLNILVIPQATLGGKLKGKAIQYHGLVSKSLGEELFYKFVDKIRDQLKSEGSTGQVQCGVYGARQILSMETNGPFTHVFEF